MRIIKLSKKSVLFLLCMLVLPNQILLAEGVKQYTLVCAHANTKQVNTITKNRVKDSVRVASESEIFPVMVSQVNQLLVQGFQPSGGISSSIYATCQAMVKFK